MRICYYLWCPRHTRLLPWMDVIKMPDTKGMTILFLCCKNIFGGQEWLNKWDMSSKPVDTASNMKVAPQKAPLCPTVATAPLDLLHVDFTSIETTMELDKSPWVANVLVFQDHFTKYVLVYVTPNQTATTVARFLYGGFISIFGAPARLLSDRGTSFTSSIIWELWTMPYHPQANGLVERSHQTIMHMIGKLGGRQESQLAITFGWNSTQSTMPPNLQLLGTVHII